MLRNENARLSFGFSFVAIERTLWLAMFFDAVEFGAFVFKGVFLLFCFKVVLIFCETYALVVVVDDRDKFVAGRLVKVDKSRSLLGFIGVEGGKFVDIAAAVVGIVVAVVAVVVG